LSSALVFVRLYDLLNMRYFDRIMYRSQVVAPVVANRSVKEAKVKRTAKKNAVVDSNREGLWKSEEMVKLVDSEQGQRQKHSNREGLLRSEEMTKLVDPEQGQREKLALRSFCCGYGAREASAVCCY
jgi:hypothetical protein